MTAFGSFTVNESKTETIIEPREVIENSCYDSGEGSHIAKEGCDFYWYSIDNKFGSYARVKAIVPDNSCVLLNDYTHDMFNEYSEPNGGATYVVDKEFPITGDSFDIGVSCVRTEGFPQVVVISAGGGNVEPVSHTSCFDGTIAGEYVDENLTTLREGAFAQCENLEFVSLPNCTKFNGGNAFYFCTNLKSVDLRNLETIASGSEIFNNAIRLQKAEFPKLTSITTTSRMFQKCSSLTEVRMPMLSGTSIEAYMFTNCSKLETIVLGGAVLNPLANTNAFTNTGNAAPNGLSIYVPDNLVDSYKTATNWSSLASKIKPMSELGE